MSDPKWVEQILAMTTAELAERNGAELLAHQLQSELRHEQRRIEYHAEEVRAYMKANAGGLAVYWLAHEAKRQGRKTLRVADILAAMDDVQALDPESSGVEGEL